MSLRALKKMKKMQGMTDDGPAPPKVEESDSEDDNPSSGFAQFGLAFFIIFIEMHLKIKNKMKMRKINQKKRKLKKNLLKNQKKKRRKLILKKKLRVK